MPDIYLRAVNLLKLAAASVFATAILGIPSFALASDVNCANASAPAGSVICHSPKLQDFQKEMSTLYETVFRKTHGDEAIRLVAEQSHWENLTRDKCLDEDCLKHAYWARAAELITFPDPKSPLYKNESEKKDAVKRVLATAPFYPMHNKPVCNIVLGALKQMKNISFVNPIVQVQSYEDPALDIWKDKWNCNNQPPLHLGIVCHGKTSDEQWGNLDICDADYGLPPFKLFDLPIKGQNKKNTYIFYSDDDFGPMNFAEKKPHFSNGASVGFWAVDDNSCSASRLIPLISGGSQNGVNYNGIFQHNSNYYLLGLYKKYQSYWLTIAPAIQSKVPLVCQWSPVKD